MDPLKQINTAAFGVKIIVPETKKKINRVWRIFQYYFLTITIFTVSRFSSINRRFPRWLNSFFASCYNAARFIFHFIVHQKL